MNKETPTVHSIKNVSFLQTQILPKEHHPCKNIYSIALFFAWFYEKNYFSQKSKFKKMRKKEKTIREDSNYNEHKSHENKIYTTNVGNYHQIPHSN